MKWTRSLKRKQFSQWQIPKKIRAAAQLTDGNSCHITLRAGRFTDSFVYTLTSGGEIRIRNAIANRLKALAEANPTSSIEFEIKLDSSAAAFSDQFSLVPPPDGISGTRTASTIIRNRDPEVRRFALLRAAGRCQLCGLSGFRLPNGAIFLETHHVIPLAEKGADSASNVVALCPNHHREAHYGRDAGAIRERLLEMLNDR